MNLQRDRSAWLHGPQHACQDMLHPLGPARRILLLGAPGVGKGTQAALLSAALGAGHLSTGDIFRLARTVHHDQLTPAMRSAIELMTRGELVPDDTVLQLVRERLSCLRCRGGFLLDGFPRTVPQAAALQILLDREGVAIDAVISYDLDESAIIARIGGRRTCPLCKAVYHTQLRAPKTADVCDVCGTALIVREDDRPEAVHVRQQAYLSATAPLLEFYHELGALVHVDASGTPEEVFARTLAALSDHFAK